jgi:hypothetical protein
MKLSETLIDRQIALKGREEAAHSARSQPPIADPLRLRLRGRVHRVASNSRSLGNLVRAELTQNTNFLSG